MTESPIVIVVGLTGVGKTTITERAIGNIETPVEYLSYGTLLLEEGKRQGLVENRDEITELGRDEYDALQTYTAEHIRDLARDGDGETVYLIDTHAALDTPFGYRPGFSRSDVETIDPTQFIFVRATPSEIQERRETDDSRDRDSASLDELDEHQTVAERMATTFAAVSRTPIAFIDNPDGEIEATTARVEPLLDKSD